MRRNRRSQLGGPGRGYPLEFRLRVVREIVENGTSLAEAMRAFGVSGTTLQIWLAKYRNGGVDALVSRVDPIGGVVEQQYVSFPETLDQFSVRVVEHGDVPLLFYESRWTDGGVDSTDIWVRRLELAQPP